VDRKYAEMSAREFRALCRGGVFSGPTAGAVLGFTQVNLVILPSPAAGDFEKFCRLNPKPCPLLEITPPGDYEPRRMAPGADLRTDLPRYRVLCEGVCVDRPPSIEDYWRGDFVSFLIGCSFTFEAALLEAGLPVRHIAEGRNVPMYQTTIECIAAGPFAGPLVVSMRPMNPRQAQRAIEITTPFTWAHGAPVHIGDPESIGIADVGRPDYGDRVSIREGEIPVFWACGVTPMEAILRARLDIAITHEPGHMFVTDLRDRSPQAVPP